MFTDNIYIEKYPIDPRICYVRITIEDFKLNAVDAWAFIHEYDKDDKFLNMSRIFIPSDVYEKWGVIDDYIIQYVMGQAGFHRKEEFLIHFPE